MDRYENLKKVSPDPVAKQLARANILIKTPLQAPASAPAAEVLAELDNKKAWIDMLLVLAVLLPPRERVWWACMAARDYIGPRSDRDPPSLTASEAWVYDPSEKNREAARQSMDHAYVDDDTVNCATSVIYADGTLGPGDLAQFPAPAGAAEAAAFAMNVVALGQLSDRFEEHIQKLIDRAVDIARGGNGQSTAAQK